MGTLVEEFVGAYLKKVRLLKESARGRVYLAEREGKPFILKELSATGLCYQKLRTLEKESALWPRIHYLAEDEGRTWLIEEYIAGESLAERLQRGAPLTSAEAARILCALSAGLALLHRAGLIHRDIKPEHILLEKGGGVRLIDFEAAREMHAAPQERDTHVLGTAGYAPPEQYGFAPTDARSDIYALGKTLLLALGPEEKGSIKKILTRCAELDPARRYQSCEAILAALKREKYLSPARKILPALALAALLAAYACQSTPPASLPAGEETTAPAEEKPAPTQSAPGGTAPQASQSSAERPAATTTAPAEGTAPAAPAPSAPSAPPTWSDIKTSLTYPDAPDGIITEDTWQSWAQPYAPAGPLDAAPRLFPTGSSLVLHVENNSSQTLTSPRVVFALPDGDTAIDLAPIAPGSSADATLDLSGTTLTEEYFRAEARFYTDTLPDGNLYDFQTFYLQNPTRKAH